MSFSLTLLSESALRMLAQPTQSTKQMRPGARADSWLTRSVDPLRAVGCCDLVADLTAVDYGYDASDAILLERKDDMRKRGLASPDDGDALALTFAHPVAKRDWAEERRFEEKLANLRRRIV